jgi:hypothetical protein
MSACRSEPGQLSQHDAVLHELEAALLELTAAEEQAKPEGEQLQLAVDALVQEPESGKVADQLSGGRWACSKWLSKRSPRGLGSIKGLTDDMLQHGRWLKVATPMAEVLEAEGMELRWQGMKALTKSVCREHVPRSTAAFTPQQGWRSISERAAAIIEIAATGCLGSTANLGKRRKAKARRIRCKQRTSTARMLRQAKQLLSRLGWSKDLTSRGLTAEVIAEVSSKRRAATVAMLVQGSASWTRCIADTGAALSCWPMTTVKSAGAGAAEIRPSQTKLRAANGGGLGVIGKQKMAFRLLGSDKDWEWDVEVVTNGTPNILGIDFWDSVQATMDLPNRCIWAQHSSGSWERLPFSATDRPTGNAATATSVSVESDNEVVASLEETFTSKQPQSLMFRGTPFWKRPFEQKQQQPTVAPQSADKQKPSTRAVVRAPKTMMLEPQQPVIVQLPMHGSQQVPEVPARELGTSHAGGEQRLQHRQG